MTREEKNQLIEALAEELTNTPNFYLADVSELNAAVTTDLRRTCFKKDVRLRTVKNTLLKKAMEKTDKELDPLYEALKGPTSVMFCEAGNAPAKLIKEFRKKYAKPLLKGAFIEEMTYLGDDQLEFLSTIKSKNELIADLIGLLQSPIKNVMSSLGSGGNTLTGILKTLSEKSE
ncbi:MAG: 50S ribosomal protein L10 [Bacteroidales bacterium]